MERDTIHQPHDKFFKQSMSDMRVAKDFLQQHLPEEILKKTDLNTLMVDRSIHIDKRYKQTEVDILYKAKTTIQPGYIYILCEQQTQADPTMAMRLLRYQLDVMERHWREYKNGCYPIVYPLVFYIGANSHRIETDLFKLFGADEALARESMMQPYQLIAVEQQSDEELKQHFWSGLMAYVMKHRHSRDAESFWATVLSWLNEIEENEGSEYFQVVVKYVLNDLESNEKRLFIEQAEKQLSSEKRGKVMTLAQCFRDEGFEQGLEQGLEQGKHEERLKLVSKLKSHGWSQEQLVEIAKVVELSPAELECIE